MRTALTIAGSDPTGGAGIQADLQVFRALGVHGAAAITALTVQDSHRVHQSLAAFPNVVLDQVRVLLRDMEVHAVKIGMLGTDDIVRHLLVALGELPAEVPIVLDPVLASSDGTSLLERRAWGALCELMPRCALVTPNLVEAEQLTGLETATREGVEAAARMFIDDFGAGAVLIKGGHRDGAPDDLLAFRPTNSSDLEMRWLAGERIDSGPIHGTGCALSAAIAAELAKGAELSAAVQTAREFVAGAIARAHSPGKGARFLGFA
jgi:hydroxymethylpyrimidine kinase/phosphomethylpyrimidine kinase